MSLGLYLIYVVYYVLDFLKVLFCCRIMKINSIISRKKIIAVSFTMLLGPFLEIILGLNSIKSFILNIIFLLILYLFMTNKQKWFFKISIFVLVFLSISFFDAIIYAFLNYTIKAYSYIYEYELTLDIYSSIICILLLLFIDYLLRYKKSKFNFSVPILVFLIVFTIGNTIIISRLFTAVLAMDVNKNYNLLFTTFLFITLALYAQPFFTSYLLLSKKHEKEKRKIINEMLEIQKEHYGDLHKQERNTKKFRHDMHEHLYIIRNLIESEDYKQLLYYLDRIDEIIYFEKLTIYTGNDYVDAILNKYLNEAKENNITLDINGRMPEDCKIDGYDLCVIFSNILKNAIKAAGQCNEMQRFVKLTIRYNRNIIIYSENSRVEPLVKEDHREHFGLENIKESIEKYSGIMKIKDDNMDHFSIQILLNNV